MPAVTTPTSSQRGAPPFIDGLLSRPADDPWGPRDLELRESVGASLEQVVEQSEKAAEWHGRRAALYGSLHILLGLPTVVLAAIAGATGLASTAGRVPAAIIALCAAALAAATGFLGSHGQREYHQRMYAEWTRVGDKAQEYQIFCLSDLTWLRGPARVAIRHLMASMGRLREGKSALTAGPPVDLNPAEEPGPIDETRVDERGAGSEDRSS